MGGCNDTRANQGVDCPAVGAEAHKCARSATGFQCHRVSNSRRWWLGWGGDACLLHRRPVFELLWSVNSGEDAHAGFSFSFSHTNDVVPDHSCSPRGRCAGGGLGLCRPGSRPGRKQDGRRGDGAHCEPQKAFSMQDATPLNRPKAKYNLELRVSPQHLATSMGRILMWVPRQSPTARPASNPRGIYPKRLDKTSSGLFSWDGGHNKCVLNTSSVP